MQWRLPPAPDRAEFISFARKIAEPAGAPFTYALTPLSIEQALTQGITLDEVARQFGAYGAAMPAQAQAMFRSIAERFGRVRVYEALTVLKLADDYALRELLANTSLAQHIIYQISPRAVVVADAAVDALAEEMVARGYTPGIL
ncbi:MAG: helicase-associated domain-containing protein [Chloroflexi bacterium]|nr:helicase-associated domain-containing protein [Chloroflexota bacterium]